MYILVRKDLPWNYRLVQSCHAVAEYMSDPYRASSIPGWDGTMVAIGVKDQPELEQWEQLLSDQGHVYSIFIEPDIDYEKTAICFMASEDEAIQEHIQHTNLL